MADSPLSSSLPSVKDLEVGYFIKPRVDMKDEAVQVNIPDFSEVPRRKPLPESSIGYAQHEENVRPFRESSLATGWSMALWKDRLRFGGEKKKQRLFLGGLIASIILLALIVGLSVGLTRNKSSNLPLPFDNGGTYSGDLTYYEPGLGACGIESTASQNICAVSRILYDAASTSTDPNQNPLCGLKLRLRRGNRSVDVTVVDRCVGCRPTDIDVSIGVFEKLALVEQGRVDVDWAWLDKPPIRVSH